MFGLRMLAVKKSMNRSAARSPAVGDHRRHDASSPAAGSRIATSVVFLEPVIGRLRNSAM